MMLSESDTRAKFIDPKLKECEWTEDLIIREHYFTDGRKLLGNKRGKRSYVDYLLRFKNRNLAIIEAKKISKHPTEGLQQAIAYAEKLHVRFVYATNGDQFYEFDLQSGKGDYVDDLPTPERLYDRCFGAQQAGKEKVLSVPMYHTGDKQARYYQEIAVNKAIEAIADGRKRVLLTLATGTGKTFIAFQIVHKLLTAKWTPTHTGNSPRILFLADRNILADQAINTFNDPYEKDLIKIDGSEVRARHGVVPTNAFIFFAIYQALSDKEKDEKAIEGYYKKYPKDFFDLVIIDECHRGSANEKGSWREILNYFDGAVHLGLTATPKRDDNVDTYHYFDKPVYEYSLKDGINDGFLTPYKVKKVRTNIDEYVHTSDDKVIKGAITKPIYKKEEFNKKIVLPKQIELIARSILDNIRPMDKSIVFCVDQEHALNMRDAINKFKMVKDPKYCVRITSDEGAEGRKLLELFQDNDKDLPVILTSSQMLTTGVDARNIRNIILVREIDSMVEFKQIIGRGTRLFEGKDFFTIIDYSEDATDKFYDDEWDGLPQEDAGNEYPESGEEPKKAHDTSDKYRRKEPAEKREKIVVELSNGRKLKVLDVETRYIDESGRPLTAREFLEKLVGFAPSAYHTEEELRKIWANPETRENLLVQLSEQGIDEEQLEQLKRIFEAEQSDIFDVLMHVSFSTDMMTRTQRVHYVADDPAFFEVYSNLTARDFLRFVLQRYENGGVKELRRDNLASLIELNNLGTTKEAAKVFGGIQQLVDAYYGLQKQLYAV